MARKSKKIRKLKQSIYIVAEGANTERIYFEAIIEQIEEQAEKYSFTVKFVETDKTDAVGLINEANSIKHECDEIWAVFDKDGYPLHQKAFEKASKYKINIAFSSIAFENWVLLHFERHKIAFDKARNLIDYLNHKNYFAGYNKKANTNIYLKLKDRTEFAMENAVWQRKEMESALQQFNGNIFEINPYTNVDHLVAKILEINYEVIWGNIGEIIEIENLSVTVNRIIPDANNRLEIEISIENRRSVTYAVNNYNHKFYLYDNGVSYLPKVFEKTILIEPSNQKTVKLIFSEPDNGYLKLDFLGERKRVIIQI